MNELGQFENEIIGSNICFINKEITNKGIMISLMKILYLRYMEVDIPEIFKQITETYEIRNIKEYSQNIC